MSEPQCTAQIAGKDGDGASRVGNDRRDADKYQRRGTSEGAASRNRVQYTCGECCGGKNGLVDQVEVFVIQKTTQAAGDRHRNGTIAPGIRAQY